MAKKKADLDLSTEEKIKEAARVVFTKKGYAATRTRDIAEEAGINLALLNYYFRSKEKLFEFVMMENAHKFFRSMKDVLNDDGSSIEKKLELMVGKYIDLLTTEPNLPYFIVSEIHNNPERLIQKLDAGDFMHKTVFFKQLSEFMMKHKVRVHPIHFVINIISATIFPFLARPMMKGVMHITDKEFYELMQERKKLIPLWIKASVQAV
jgi:AcrR family transcriptional regulator